MALFVHFPFTQKCKQHHFLVRVADAWNKPTNEQLPHSSLTAACAHHHVLGFMGPREQYSSCCPCCFDSPLPPCIMHAFDCRPFYSSLPGTPLSPFSPLGPILPGIPEINSKSAKVKPSHKARPVQEDHRVWTSVAWYLESPWARGPLSPPSPQDCWGQEVLGGHVLQLGLGGDKQQHMWSAAKTWRKKIKYSSVTNPILCRLGCPYGGRTQTVSFQITRLPWQHQS